MTTCFAVYTPDNWPLVTWVPSNARATPAPPPPKKKGRICQFIKCYIFHPAFKLNKPHILAIELNWMGFL